MDHGEHWEEQYKMNLGQRPGTLWKDKQFGLYYTAMEKMQCN